MTPVETPSKRRRGRVKGLHTARIQAVIDAEKARVVTTQIHHFLDAWVRAAHRGESDHDASLHERVQCSDVE